MRTLLKKQWNALPLEAIVWASGLLAMALIEPTHEQHFTLCLFSQLGFDFCPGCGLGRSIVFLFHGEVLQSFQTHPFGLLAVIILSYRIFQLLKQHIKSHGKSY
jgi:hypothetical protein